MATDFRTNYFCTVFLLFSIAPRLTFSQINISGNGNSSINVKCPSGFTCFSSFQNRTLEWGYNGHICSGQTDGQCYKGESDPRGFIRGPMQIPIIIYLGDRLFFKTTPGLSIQPFNVSRSGFHSCSPFDNANAVSSSLSSMFEIPTNYIDSAGFKYFIAKTNSFVYQCQFGLKLEVFVRSASACVNPTAQASGVCSNKGLCAISGKFFTYNLSCKCQTGYYGTYCEQLNSCDSALNLCRNGATCVDKTSGIANDYECRCIPGYSGKNCETNVNDCVPKPCKNGAACLDGIATYTCLCQPGYHGKNCSNLNPNSCDPNPCENGGTCSLDENRHNYTCQCPDPFVGRNCSNNATLLSSSIPTVSSMVMSSAVVTSTPSSSVSSKTVLPQSTSVYSTVSTSKYSTTVPTSSISVHSSTVHVQTSSVSVHSPTVHVPTSSVSVHSPTVQVPTSSISANSSTVATLSASIHSSSPSTSDVSTVPDRTTSVTSKLSSHVTATSSDSLMSSVVVSTTKAASTTNVLQTSPSTGTQTVTPATSALSTSTPTVLPTSTIAVTTTMQPSLVSTSSMLSSTASSVSASATPNTQTSTTTMIPTTTKSFALPSSSISPTSAASSSVSTTSSVVPTTVAPTTVPLREHTCKDKPCNTGMCLDTPDSLGFNFTCQCSKPTYGPRCSTDYKLHFPRFGNKSYLVHKPIAFASGFNKIVITFKTTKSDGLLFYSTHNKYRDFIQLYLTNGNLEYRFDPGDSLVAIRSSVKVNTGKIVTAVVTYDSSNKEGSLKVDNNPIQKTRSRGNFVGIGLYSEWYIGGLPPGKKFGVNDEAKTTPTFNGCIRDIELNGNNIGFTEATDWNNLNECDKPCDNQPCHNGGNCTNDVDDPHDYQCTCPDGYEGKNCKKYRICSGDPCKGGLCIANVEKDSKKCLCPYGRAGFNCENVLNITVPCLSMADNYSSYIQYQTPTQSGPYFAVTLQFKLDNTSTASLLMYSGQDQFQGKGDDFVALGINNGKVVFQYDLGSGLARITSDNLDSKLDWHSVTAGRSGKEGYLYVDSQLSKRGSSPGELSGLNLYSPLYIGGVPELTELSSNVDFRSGFQGCISNMAVRFGAKEQFISLLTTQTGSNGWPVVTGRNVGDKNYSSCKENNPCQNNGTCVTMGACSCVDGWKGMFCSSKDVPCISHNPCASWSTCREVNNKAVCDCPLGKTGSTCSQSLSIQTPQFNENSYMAYNPKNSSGQLIYIRATTNIKITFKPSTTNGLLFYVAHQISSQKGDFLSISLHNGVLHYRYDLGSGLAKFQSQKSISLNNQHTVEITRTAKTGTLKVDSEPVISATSLGDAVALDVSSDFYLGGVPQLSYVNPSAVFDSSSLKDFVGCVSSVRINGVTLVLTETGAKEGRNINNCPSTKPVIT